MEQASVTFTPILGEATFSLSLQLAMTEIAEASCPYCGEVVDLIIEAGDGRQEYVEDCPVCCQPWQVTVEPDLQGGWSAGLRTTDE